MGQRVVMKLCDGDTGCGSLYYFLYTYVLEILNNQKFLKNV